MLFSRSSPFSSAIVPGHRSVHPHLAISHGGDDPGAHSICFLLPKSGKGIIIFTNSENGTKLYIDLIKNYLAENGQAILDIELK